MVNRALLGLILLGPIVALAALAVIFAAQIPYPGEINTFEGGLFDEVWRVVHGLPLYPAPSIDYVPFIYAPGFVWASAVLGLLTGLDLTTLRLVSALGTLLVLAALFAVVARRSDWRWGVLAAGLYAACFALGYGWYALGRVDNLALGLFCVGVWALEGRTTDLRRLAAALLLAAAIWTKQSMVIAMLPVLAWAAFSDRRLLVASLAVLIGCGAIPLFLWNGAAGGWVGFYTVAVGGQTTGEWPRVLGFVLTDLRALAIVMVLALLGMILRYRAPSAAPRLSLPLAAALGLVAAAWFSREFAAGWYNVLIPAFAAVAGAGALGAQYLWQAAQLSPRAMALRSVLAGAIAVQFVVLSYDARLYLPEPGAAARLRAIQQQLGQWARPLWLGGDGYLLCRPQGADTLALTDLQFEPARHDQAVQGEFRRRLNQGYYATVLVPDYAAVYWLPDLGEKYRLAMKLGEGAPRLALASADIPGQPTWPYWVFVRK